MLRKEGEEKLASYKVDIENKKYEFWQRDSLAIPLFTKKVAIQKLKYIHYNPLAEHWQLVKDPCDYKYSSARYYELNEKNFSFLKDLWVEF
jgi:putative transposase